MPPKRSLSGPNKENITFNVLVDSLPPKKKIRRSKNILSDEEARRVQAAKIAERQSATAVQSAEELSRNREEELERHREVELERHRNVEEEHEELRKRKEKEAEEKRRLDSEERLGRVLDNIRTQGWTVGQFFEAFLKTTDRKHSSMATQTLQRHGPAIFAHLQARTPDVYEYTMLNYVKQTITNEAKELLHKLRPASGTSVAYHLSHFSLDDLSAWMQDTAPFVWMTLQQAGTPVDMQNAPDKSRRNRGLVFATAACMLAQARSERSNAFQRKMSFWLLASGATHTQFEVLSHAGLMCSYATTLRELKQLSEERLEEARLLVQTRPFLLVWDNLNVADRKAEQRKHSKNTFDNGTTSTLLALAGINIGDFPLQPPPPRIYSQVVVDYTREGLLPPAAVAADLDRAHRWAIQKILFDFFPELRAHIPDDCVEAEPTVLRAPVCEATEIPLAAKKIDESSIDGTIDVVEMLATTLNITEEVIKKWGVVFAAGDLLTASLVETVCGCRRDDTELRDNMSRWIITMLGLFHVKMAAARMIANEFWGKANALVLWSLWKVNSLLRRTPITVGWKASKLAPFREIYELILTFALVANILDAYRVCLDDHDKDLDSWVARLKRMKNGADAYQEIVKISNRVQRQLANRNVVYRLRRMPDDKRDRTLENIILFNHDALTLYEYRRAISIGDIGRVVNVLTFWMVEFRGTGSMPKYADALFQTLTRLKTMDEKTRHAFLMNWLVNTSGRPNGFKEVDLLQEHHNFWAKIIYSAKGSNRSWRWLGMVTLCIKSLREVLRNVNNEFGARYSGVTHTSPDTREDIIDLLEYLQRERLQTYMQNRAHNDDVIPARDFMAAGAAYADTPRAFRNFRRDTRNATYKPTCPSRECPAECDTAIPPIPNVDNSMEEPTQSDANDKDEMSEEDMWMSEGIDEGTLAMDIEGELCGQSLQEMLDVARSIANSFPE